jgi:hypothetical protein
VTSRATTLARDRPCGSGTAAIQRQLAHPSGLDCPRHRVMRHGPGQSAGCRCGGSTHATGRFVFERAPPHLLDGGPPHLTRKPHLNPETTSLLGRMESAWFAVRSGAFVRCRSAPPRSPALQRSPWRISMRPAVGQHLGRSEVRRNDVTQCAKHGPHTVDDT